jgi:hypothetical protein
MDSALALPLTKSHEPRLKLFDAPDAPPSPEVPATRFGRGSRLSPDAKLRVLFEEFFHPIVLCDDRDPSSRTLTEYATSLDHWERITGDPAIVEIDLHTLAAFKAGLRVATFARGPLAPRKKLSAFTQTKHLKNIRALLERCGPTVDRDTPCADLVDYMPHLRIKSPKRLLPAPVPTLEQVRAVFREANRLADPRERLRWLARLSVIHYGGLRFESMQALSVDMVRTVYERRWLAIDSDDIKTGNALAVPLHSEAGAALDRLGIVSGPFFPPATYDQLRYRYKKLQLAAGIAKPLGFHAARRFHSEQMNLLGADHGDLAAQASLDHSSGRTTRESYSRAKSLLIESFPKLLVDADDAGQLRLF